MLDALHRQVCAGNQEAANLLREIARKPLIQRLCRKYEVSGGELVEEAVHEALREYCFYLLLAFAAVVNFSSFDESAFYRVMARWPRDGDPVFLSHFATWDAAHYLRLSELGYAKDISSCAFYPLWPLVVRWFSVVTGGNHVVSGMILANIFSAVGFTLFYWLVKRRFGSRQAWLALIFLLVFPGSLFFHFVYSEALFFLLLMIFVLGLEQRRYAMAWVAGFLLPMTRAVGILCLLPLLWHGARKCLFASEAPALRRWWRRSGSVCAVETEVEESVKSTQAWRRKARWAGLLAVLGAAPLLGYGLYFALMWHWTGNPWEGFRAQRFWNVRSISHSWDAPRFVSEFITPTSWHEYRGSVLDRAMLILLLYCLPVIWKLDKEWFIWTVVLGVVPAMSAGFISFTRYASVGFPMFIALGVVFSDRRWRWVRDTVLTVFALLHAVLVWRLVNFRWAG